MDYMSDDGADVVGLADRADSVELNDGSASPCDVGVLLPVVIHD